VANLAEKDWRVLPYRSDAVLQAAIESLTDVQRSALRDALVASADQWEVRANPLVESLDNTLDPDAAMSTWQKTAPTEPAIARSFVTWRYCGNDGLCVEPRVGPTCAVGFRTPKDREAVRARTLAWPYGYAATLSSAQLGDRVQFTKDCRARFGACLVLDPRANASPEMQALMDVYKRYEALKALVQNGAENGRPRDEGRQLPWLLPEGQVLVVPGLRAIGEEPAFRAFVAGRKVR
jgi:hypothetical protein